MSRDLFEELQPLMPVDFFNLEVELKLGKKLELPDTSELLAEEPFAEVSVLVKPEGLQFFATIKKPFEECFYPQFDRGDCLELFIDTRDLKTAGFMTRFCHHFLILPANVDTITSQEITHFRSEDAHPLCDPAELEVVPEFSSSRYKLHITIPSSCLHGYDPAAFKRLGFTYRINRTGGYPQHFAVSSHQYNIAQQPSLWASLKWEK